jgi:CRP/FNR family transcriptional regulator, cyclic AMP receptor protein
MTSANARLPLEGSVLEMIAKRGIIRHYPARTILINEGDTGDSLFIVVKGLIRVYASSREGREVTLGLLGPGEYVGELSLDGSARDASVMTMEATTCAIVNGSALKAFVEQHPAFATRLILDLIGRVRSMSGMVKGLAFNDAYRRTVELLRNLSEPDGATRVVQVRLTQQDIADMVGCSRESVNRVVKELLSGGYIEMRSRKIVLLKDPPARW